MYSSSDRLLGPQPRTYAPTPHPPSHTISDQWLAAGVSM